MLKWERPQADAYAAVLSQAAEHSGGGLLADVPRTVHDCPDHEDNLILDLAAEVGAMLVVSNDTDLLSMSPWRGTPILAPAAFAAKVEGSDPRGSTAFFEDVGGPVADGVGDVLDGTPLLLIVAVCRPSSACQWPGAQLPGAAHGPSGQ